MRRQARRYLASALLVALTIVIGGCGVRVIYSSFTVGGNVSGLAAGALLILLLNDGDSIEITTDGPFTFTEPVPEGDPYSVTVGTPPSGEQCTVSSGSGSDLNADVDTVDVECIPSDDSQRPG